MEIEYVVYLVACRVPSILTKLKKKSPTDTVENIWSWSHTKRVILLAKVRARHTHVAFRAQQAQFFWSPPAINKVRQVKSRKKPFHIAIPCVCWVVFSERSNWIICYSQKVYLRVYSKLRSHLTEKHNRGFQLAAGLRNTSVDKHYYLHAL